MRNIYHGIHNLIKWFPIIWHDRDWDWEYLARMMEFKFRNMSHLFKEHGVAVGSEKQAKELLTCAELIKRLRDNDTCDLDVVESWQKMLGDMIGKKLRSWWD